MERANMKKRGGQRDGRWQEYLTASVEYSQTHTEGYPNARIPVAFDIECRVIYVPVHTHTHTRAYISGAVRKRDSARLFKLLNFKLSLTYAN